MSKKGSLEVIVGSMFSGKTTELLRRLERLQIAKKNIVVFKPEKNDRDGKYIVTDRNKKIALEAHNLPEEGTEKDLEKVIEMVRGFDVVGIDEVQFFGAWVIPLCKKLMDMGKQVIVCGLDMDFKAEPFGYIGDLMAISTFVDKFRAVCMCCGEDASYNQRLKSGKPAPEGPIVQIGDKESYEARCINCYVHPSLVKEENE